MLPCLVQGPPDTHSGLRASRQIVHRYTSHIYTCPTEYLLKHLGLGWDSDSAQVWPRGRNWTEGLIIARGSLRDPPWCRLQSTASIKLVPLEKLRCRGLENEWGMSVLEEGSFHIVERRKGLLLHVLELSLVSRETCSKRLYRSTSYIPYRASPN
ncbi:hypothetical protein BDV10DRAFT_178211 [Aspergillus recurvatus]